MDAAELVLIEARYDREMVRGSLTLAFEPELERRFRADLSEAVVQQRLILTAIVAMTLLLQPLMDRWLLFPPAGFVPLERRVQFFLMLPATLLAFAVTAIPRTRFLSDAAALFLAVVVASCLLYQRRVAAEMGYYVPSLLVA